MPSTSISQRPVLGYEIDLLHKEIAGLQAQVLAAQQRVNEVRVELAVETCKIVVWAGTFILLVHLFWCIVWVASGK